MQPIKEGIYTNYDVLIGIRTVYRSANWNKIVL
jgi:hypothetical protein